MSKERIRALLKEAPDGMTNSQIVKLTGMQRGNVNVALRHMADVYVDRWQPAKAGPHKYAAVFMAADVPENAPKPS